MVVKAKEVKSPMICAVCNEEFTGKKCPQCGNTKDNKVLAGDGIPAETHSESAAFGSVVNLRPTDMALNREFEMSQELARNQQIELQDNLRESYVIKSQLRKLDLENKLKEKKTQYDPPPPIQQQAPRVEPLQAQIPNPFTQPQMSPQALFMNKFMNLDADDRTEFLNQLAEADPAALSTLSGFFAQAQQQMPQQSMMNPYGQQMPNPYMQMPPPWMQQQQYEPQQPADDPTTVALTIVDKLHDLSAKSQQAGPSEESQVVALLREELRAVNERLSAMGQDSRSIENETILMELAQMRAEINQPRQGTGIREQISGMKEMVTDLREIGFMPTPESTNSVDEQIKLDQAKHSIKKEDRQLEMEELKLEAGKSDKEMRKNLVSGLFNRQLQKSISPVDATVPIQQPQHTPLSTGPMSETPYELAKPAVVLDEMITDAGVVRETRAPIRKDGEE